MNALRDFFREHIKTRVALVLMLEALPTLLLCGFIAVCYNIFSYPLELQWLVDISFWGFLIGTLPILIIGIIFRRRSEAEISCFDWCETVSRILFIPGVLSAMISLGIDLVLLYNWLMRQ